MDATQRKIVAELNSRIERLKEHQNDPLEREENGPYADVNRALSRVIGLPLQKELEDLKSFVENL